MSRQTERQELFRAHLAAVKKQYDIPRSARRKIARKLAHKEYQNTPRSSTSPPAPPTREEYNLRAKRHYAHMANNENNMMFGQKRHRYPTREDIKRRAEEKAKARMEKPPVQTQTRFGRTWGALARVLRGK